MKSCGFLQPMVCVFGIGLPIPFSTVTIYDHETKAKVFHFCADDNGSFSKISLPCPTRTDSPAYRRYTICATAPNYDTFTETIPIFDGVTTVQAFPLQKIQ